MNNCDSKMSSSELLAAQRALVEDIEGGLDLETDGDGRLAALLAKQIGENINACCSEDGALPPYDGVGLHLK